MLLWLLLALGLFCICLNHPPNLCFAPKTCLLCCVGFFCGHFLAKDRSAEMQLEGGMGMSVWRSQTDVWGSDPHWCLPCRPEGSKKSKKEKKKKKKKKHKKEKKKDKHHKRDAASSSSESSSDEDDR